MKRRSLTLVLCLLATLSLASVGFAAWVISAGDIENATGQINVDTVTDNRIMISEIKLDDDSWDFEHKTWTDGGDGKEAEFVFGKPETGSHPWLENNSLTEVLTLTLKFKVIKVDGGAVVTDAQTSVILAAAEGTNFGNWIEVVTPVADNQGKGAAAAHQGEGWYQCTLQLRWGSAWGNVNPYTYFSGKEIDGKVYINNSYEYKEVETDGYTETTWGQFAVDKLKAMQLALASAKFQITIDAQPAAQNQN